MDDPRTSPSGSPTGRTVLYLVLFALAIVIVFRGDPLLDRADGHPGGAAGR